MFQTYWQQQERYDSRFVNGWYITGDEAVRDSDGYYWFIGRTDDVINTRRTPRRPIRGRVRPHRTPRRRRGRRHRQAGPHRDGGRQGVRLAQGRLRAERRVAPRADGLRAPEARPPPWPPREIEIIPGLPKTRSGKIMRRLLKARELGLDEGDTSTLEED